jgi:uncharacterized membrane protein
MNRALLPAALLAALLPACGAAPAHAALSLCNRTSYILYTATAALKGQKGEASGWTRLVPGDCATARKERLTGARYLVHARSSLAYSGPARAWGGAIPLCVKDGNFALPETSPANCAAEETFALGFAPLDTKGRSDWTMNFDENPPWHSLRDAQLAGVKRLLAAAGEKPGPVSAAPDKATGTALAAFRKRMHFTSQAGNTELFNALETEALKTSAPAGYTVCNDTAQQLSVALGWKHVKGATSRGWWTVAPGACARAITTALTGDAIYLLAQHKDGKLVAGGDTRFCTAAPAFEIHGANDCAGRGYGAAGFARTGTRGRAGYIAHITQTGRLK